MAKLLKITSTNSQLVFQIRNNNTKQVFFANTSQHTSFEPVETKKTNTQVDLKYNKDSLYVEKNDNYRIFYNMYDSKDPMYKSSIYKKGKTQRTNTTNDFYDVINHKLSCDLINTIQIDNIIYALEPRNEYGRYNLSCDILNYLSADNNQLLPRVDKIKTIIYNYDDKTKQLDIKNELTSIKYNTIYEINGSIYNDYESGNIIANTFKGKNQFDSTYNMKHDDEYILKNAREYIDIDKCGNQIYLKYYDNICCYKNDLTECYNSDKNTKCQNIEVIHQINRFDKLDNHKTNLYSIAIQTDILDQIKQKITKIDNDELTLPKQNILINILINNLILEIKNSIKNIIKNIQPAHTQLLDVYVNGI